MLQSLKPIIHLVDDKGPNGVDGRIVAYLNKDSHISEQYRVMQSHINTLKETGKIKIIMITSGMAEDGKTITCCNLASSIAADPNKKTVLVDFDTRKPTIHTLFNIKRSPGLTDIIEGKTSASIVLKAPAAGNLYIIPAGTEINNPYDLLRTQATKDFLERLKSSFDYIIIDTPPTIPVSDSRIIGSMCDAVVLVVKFDKTSKKSIRDTFALLKIAHATPLACILNNFLAPIYSYTRYSQYCYEEPAKERT